MRIMGDTKDREFLTYINTPLTDDSVIMLYGANNIRHIKCDLYKDFSDSICQLVFDTYLGDDVTNSESRLKHFTWCWDKTIENFNTEGIVFSNHKNLHDYFYNFMIEAFYSVANKSKDQMLTTKILKLWELLFDIRVRMSRADFDTLLDLYEMFDKSLETPKK
jgi:hypothetical protein